MKKITSIGVVYFIVINMTHKKKYIGVVEKETKMQSDASVKNIKPNKNSIIIISMIIQWFNKQDAHVASKLAIRHMNAIRIQTTELNSI